MRDGNACTLCLAPAAPGQKHDWAHLLSRRYLNTRWDFQNSTTLCRSCHYTYTRRPDEWFDLCQRKMGLVAWERLKLRAFSRGKVNLDLWEIAVRTGPVFAGVVIKPW